MSSFTKLPGTRNKKEISIVVTRNINYIKFISSTGKAENFFANVSIGYAH